jgi:Flp pilus assembly protein TadD
MLNQYEEALDCLNKSLDINPEDITTLNNKAAALRRVGREAEAAEYDEKVRELMITRGPHTVL